MRATAAWVALIPAAAFPASAEATVYFTIPAAQQAMFPGARMIDRSIPLGNAERKAIARAAGTAGVDKVQRAWEAQLAGKRVGWFLVDRVIGKHDYITYALALGPDGAVKGIEILDYRESYGGEIRNPNWRRQFAGRRPGQALRLGGEIKNISGATLSSRHVTDGVRRLLVTWQMLLAGR